MPTGMIDQSTIVAKTNEIDCDADLVMVTLADAGPRYTMIDRAPGCKKNADGAVEDDAWYDSILLVSDKTKSRLYARVAEAKPPDRGSRRDPLQRSRSVTEGREGVDRGR